MDREKATRIALAARDIERAKTDLVGAGDDLAAGKKPEEVQPEIPAEEFLAAQDRYYRAVTDLPEPS